MFDPKVHVGVAILVAGRRQTLMLKRAKDASHGGGLWSVPGGWIDFGETPEQACVRELAEETGIETGISEFAFVDAVANTYPEENMHVICLFYELIHGPTPRFKNLEPDKHTEMEYRDLYSIDGEELEELFPPLRTYLDRVRFNYR